MKYALLIYDDEQAWGSLDDATRGAMYEEYGKFSAGLEERGQMRAGEQLSPTSTATTVRVKDGKTLTTDGPYAETKGRSRQSSRDSKVLLQDGPYAETKEALGGFFIIDVKDLNDAIRVASKIPAARLGSIEVRPMREGGCAD